MGGAEPASHLDCGRREKQRGGRDGPRPEERGSVPMSRTMTSVGDVVSYSMVVDSARSASQNYNDTAQ